MSLPACGIVYCNRSGTESDGSGTESDGSGTESDGSGTELEYPLPRCPLLEGQLLSINSSSHRRQSQGKEQSQNVL